MKIKLFSLAIAILICPSIASAQFLGGGVFFAESEDAAIGSEFRLRGLRAGNTYVCSMSEVFASGLSTSIMAPSGPISGTFAGNDYPAIQLTDDEDDLNLANNEILDTDSSDNRIAFQAPDSGDYIFTIASWATDSLTRDAFLICSDSTANVGFNTFLNDFNFLEVTNNLERELTVNWEAVNFDGTRISGSINVGAGLRADIDIHTAVGPSSFGNIKVGILGVEGSAILNMSQYQTTGSGVEQRTSRKAELNQLPASFSFF